MKYFAEHPNNVVFHTEANLEKVDTEIRAAA